MIALAVAHSPVLRPLGLRILESPESATTIYDYAISINDPFFGPQAALAEFDSVLSGSVNTQNNDRVFNNATLGGDVQELVQDLVSFEYGWQKRSTRGGVWEINRLTGYDSNNRVGNRFPSYWETQLQAGVRQPLLRGAGKQFNLIAGPNARPGFNFSNGIVIARLNNRINQADFEIELRRFIEDLIAAYWDLDRHYRNYASVQEAQLLAYKTWQSVLAKSRADLAGGEANKEAQARADYYSYCREVQVALGGQNGQGGLYVAERRLRRLIGLPVVDGQLLRPVGRAGRGPVRVRLRCHQRESDVRAHRTVTPATESPPTAARGHRGEELLASAARPDRPLPATRSRRRTWRAADRGSPAPTKTSSRSIIRSGNSAWRWE